MVHSIKRWHILSRLIRAHKYRLGVEIGVKSGRNIKEITNACPHVIVHAVDPWEITPNYSHWTEDNMRSSETNFDNVMARRPNCIIKHKMLSNKAVSLFKDEALDFVFIDGDHSYKGVKDDIKIWLPKIRKGGLISGHDYAGEDKRGVKFIGVAKAVHEQFGDNVELAEDHVWWRLV